MNQTFPTKNINAFTSSIVALRSEGILFDKSSLNKLASSAENECFGLSKRYMGDDFDFLHNAVMAEAGRDLDPNYPDDEIDVTLPVRNYVMDTFGKPALRLFEDMWGTVHFDIEHAILFYYKMKALGFPDMNKAFGFIYYVAGHQFEDEISRLASGVSKGLLKPSFNTSPNFFGWKKMPFITNKYVMSLVDAEDYDKVFFERQNVGYIAYLMANDYSIGDAKKVIESASGGLFYSWLPLHVENALLPAIFDQSFDTQLMDGYLRPLYEKNIAMVRSEYDIDGGQHTMYNYLVKPHLINMQGVFIAKVQETMMVNGVSPRDIRVYHASPYRVGFLVRKGIDGGQALGDIAMHLKKVPEFSVMHLIEGNHL